MPCMSHPVNDNHSIRTQAGQSVPHCHVYARRETLKSSWRAVPTHQPPTPKDTGPARPPTMAFRASRVRASGLLLSTACRSRGYLVMRWWGLMSKSPSICLPERLCFSHHCQGRWAGVSRLQAPTCSTLVTDSGLGPPGDWEGRGPSCLGPPICLPGNPSPTCVKVRKRGLLSCCSRA